MDTPLRLQWRRTWRESPDQFSALDPTNALDVPAVSIADMRAISPSGGWTWVISHPGAADSGLGITRTGRAPTKNTAAREAETAWFAFLARLDEIGDRERLRWWHEHQKVIDTGMRKWANGRTGADWPIQR